MSTESGLRAWLGGRAAAWQDLTTRANELERGSADSVQTALATIDGYRALGRDLSMARRVSRDGRLTRAIEQLYLRLHSIIHRKPHRFRSRVVSLFRDEIPAIAFELRPTILSVALLMLLSAAAAYWLVDTYPELVTLFASEQMIEGVERGHLWTEGLINVVPSSVLSVSILTNNIVVSFIAFAVGVFFWLGTFYMISLNGAMLGGMLAFTHRHGMAGELAKFITAHGLVELSVICLAGAAGVMVGESLIRPTRATRRESFQYATGKAIKLLILCTGLLIVCGFIEGYLSPDPDFPMWNRLVVGFSYWFVMLSALSGHLFRRRGTFAARQT